MSAILELTDLTVSIPTSAGVVVPVQDLSLTVGQGEIVGVVGESGCGKSTMLRAVAGVLPRGSTSTGTVRVCGVDATPGQRATEAAMIFQDPMTSLNPVMTVGDLVVEVPRYRDGMSKSAARGLAVDLLREVGIEDAERRLGFYPHQLSGGLRQRVMIAAALSGSPKLLLCDEPTTALDVTVQSKFIGLLRRLVETRGLGILYVTHDLPLLGTMCDRINVMYAGQVIERGSRQEVLERPAHPYTSALLAAAPRIEARAQTLTSIPGHPPRLIEPVGTGCRFAPRCPLQVPACSTAGDLLEVSAGHRTTCIRPLVPAQGIEGRE